MEINSAYEQLLKVTSTTRVTHSPRGGGDLASSDHVKTSNTHLPDSRIQLPRVDQEGEPQSCTTEEYVHSLDGVGPPGDPWSSRITGRV